MNRTEVPPEKWQVWSPDSHAEAPARRQSDDKDLEVRFISYLRPEKKFENVDALVRQIEADVKQARALCAA